MNLFAPSRYTRLNEAVGFLLLLLGLAVVLSLVSYSPADPSWNTATAAPHANNLLGLAGAKWSDFLLQAFGISAFLLPLHIWSLGWTWLRSAPVESPWFRIFGGMALWFCVSAGCGLAPNLVLISGTIRPSGIVGMVIADFLISRCNLVGAAIITTAAGVIALYFASTFEVSTLMRWLSGPLARWNAFLENWRARREAKRQAAIAKARARAAERAQRAKAALSASVDSAPVRRGRTAAVSAESARSSGSRVAEDEPPFDLAPEQEEQFAEDEDIPIRTLEYEPITQPEPPLEDENDRAILRTGTQRGRAQAETQTLVSAARDRPAE